MKLMSIVFVEDAEEEIGGIITTLESSKYFDIAQYKDYSLVPEQRIRNSDLFVLDVLTAGGDEPFCKFIGTLQVHRRPFLAFTRMHEHGVLRSLSGGPRLRQTVFEHGGLGIVSKFAAAGEEARVSRKDLQLDLIERIMNVHWSWRMANQ